MYEYVNMTILIKRVDYCCKHIGYYWAIQNSKDYFESYLGVRV